jgi:hypothetical protein
MAKLHNIGQEIYNRMLRFINILKNITNRIANLNENQKAYVIKTISDKPEKFSEDDIKDFTFSIDYIKKNRDQINMSFEIGMEFYARKNLGFSCALCDQISHSSLLDDSEYGMKIMTNANVCQNFLKSDEMYHFISSIINIKQIFIFYGDLFMARNYTFDIDVSNIGEPDEIDDFMETIKECGEEENIVSNNMCLDMCNMYGVFNTNFFSMYMIKIFSFDIVGGDFLGKTDFNTEESNVNDEDYNENILFHFFIEPQNEIKDGRELEDLLLVYTNDQGWDNSKYEFIPGFVDEMFGLSSVMRESSRVFSVLFVVLNMVLFF